VVQILFFIAALGAIGGAMAVVLLRNPFFSVLALVIHLMALSVLFLLLHAEFLAAAQLIVYAGAVMVLYLFVVSYVGGSEEALSRAGAPRALAPVFGVALLFAFSLAVGGSELKALSTHGGDLAAGFGSPAQIGELLLTKFLLPFEISSYLLTIAAVGAVLLARRRRGLEPLEETAAGEGGEA
jgi:NADH-quinone oxidoreductase subunit J